MRQLAPLAATLLMAVLTVLWVYSVRPIVRALRLSSTIRIVPKASVIMATYRLYQPDTRSMWSSYHFSSEVRNRPMSSPASLTRASSDVLNGIIVLGVSASMLCWMVVIVVCPWESGTTRSMTASANDFPEK